MRVDEIKLGKAEDLSNQKFGRLTLLYRVNNIGKHTAWKCKCECGNLINAPVHHLKDGKIKSCGCYNKEKAKEHLKNINKKGKNMKDITGLKSGWLVALEPTNKRRVYGNSSSHVIWRCQCMNPIHSSPIFCEATCTDITTKNKTSCGCINSKGEAKIIQLLIENNIPFEQQKSFETCRFPNSKYLAKFDFYVNNQYLIEFDGKQHFNQNSSGWGESLKEIQERDNYKTLWCKENNIHLIRIPYWKIDTLTINDLR